MNFIDDFFSELRKKTILVVGDLMIDQYVFGKSERQSPEAPVPVVDVEKEENRAGGAANVALNLRSFGCKVRIAGITGNDREGKTLLAILDDAGIKSNTVIRSGQNRTTVKTRIIANDKHMLRLDNENNIWADEDEKWKLSEILIKKLKRCDAIVIEDYDKGVLDAESIRRIISHANELSIPVVVDPKFRNFFSYAGCSIFKPNLKELNEALKKNIQKDDLKGIREAVLELRGKMPHSKTLLTLGDNGMFGMDENENAFHIPARQTKVIDVSGAGDAVVAVLGLGMACGLSFRGMAGLANLAGSIACEEVGVIPVDAVKLKKEWQSPDIKKTE